MSEQGGKSVVWVNSKNGELDRESISFLENRIGFSSTFLEQTTDLFPLLSNCNFTVDLIVFNLDNLYGTEGVDALDMISTVSTLAKCTVNRVGPGKPKVRNPILAIYISGNTDRAILKKITKTEITGIVPVGGKFSSNDQEFALIELFNGHTYLPKKFFEPVVQKKVIHEDGISLTPRQEQILKIIKERGSSNKTIAKMLNLSESTVKLHITQILKKYGVKNRTQLAVFSSNR